VAHSLGARNPTDEEDWPVQLRADGYDAVLSEGIGIWSTSFDDLVEMYAFADRRDALGLSDVVISMVLEKVSMEGRVPVEMLERLLGNTVAGRDSHMFDMLAEVAALFVPSTDLEVHLEAVPKEFLVAVLGRQRVGMQSISEH
jgi:hypothetical protein